MYERSQYIQDRLDSIAARKQNELKGIVTNAEVPRICAMIRYCLASGLVEDVYKKRLRRLAGLMRKFTVAEADMVTAIHGAVLAREKKLAETQQRKEVVANEVAL